MSKKSVIAAVVASLVSLGGAHALEAAPASATKAHASSSVAPAKNVHSKKKAHRAAHAKKGKSAAAPKAAAK
jgi:hypothetical protein